MYRFRLLLYLLLLALPLRGQLLPSNVVVPLRLPFPGQPFVLTYPPVPILPPPGKLKPGITVVMVPDNPPPRPRRLAPRYDHQLQAANAKKLVQWLVDHQWVRETHGNNRSPFIDGMVRAGGGKPGWPYCGYTQLADQKAQKLPYPAGGQKASNCFVDKARLSYRVGTAHFRLDSVRVGDLLGVSYSAGINHVTRVKQIVRDPGTGRIRGFWCLGGNEGSGRNAGIHLTWYPAVNVVATSNYSY
jgi:hypothetical protein